MTMQTYLIVPFGRFFRRRHESYPRPS